MRATTSIRVVMGCRMANTVGFAPDPVLVVDPVLVADRAVMGNSPRAERIVAQLFLAEAEPDRGRPLSRQDVPVRSRTATLTRSSRGSAKCQPPACLGFPAQLH